MAKVLDGDASALASMQLIATSMSHYQSNSLEISSGIITLAVTEGRGSLLQVAVYMPDDPITCAYRGGAMMAATPAFAQMAITRQVYEEEGAARMQTAAADE